MQQTTSAICNCFVRPLLYGSIRGAAHPVWNRSAWWPSALNAHSLATLHIVHIMQEYDIAIPTLPSRSIRDTLTFYRRLGFEGEVLGVGDAYAFVEAHLSFTSSPTLRSARPNHPQVAMSGFQMWGAFSGILPWRSCPGEAFRVKMPSETSLGDEGVCHR